MGMDHLVKAEGFQREHNWSQLLRHSDLAATKLKQLKDRPVVEISDALSMKCTALGFLGQYREQLECAKEWYCLWNTKPTDLPAIDAAFALIESCIQNNKYDDAVLYASTLWEIINHKHDNKIPEDRRQAYIARGAYFLAQATLHLSQNGGIPLEEKQKAGQEAISLLRRAMEIHTRLHGNGDVKVSNVMGALADALDYFNDVDDDEILRLLERTIAIYVRVYGNLSVNVAGSETNLGAAYLTRATRARAAKDLDREQVNLELALPRFREASRIFRVVNRMDMVERTGRAIEEVEMKLQRVVIARTAAADAAAAAATRG